MDVRRWGLVMVASGWLVGLALAAGHDLGPVRLAWLFGGLAVLALAGTATWVAAWHARQTLLPLATSWQLALAALWCLAAVALGIARFAWSLPGNDPANVANLAPGTSVTVVGTIDAEPDVHATGTYLIIRVATVQISGAPQPATGAIEIFDAHELAAFAPDYGDQVSARGTLAAVPPHAPPGTDAVLQGAKLQITRYGGGNPVLAILYQWRTGIANALEHDLPAPEAALLIGILLGLKTPTLRQRLALFTRTGTIHLVVTSGLKVTLVGSLIEGVVRRWGRLVQLILPLAGIALYVVLSGAGPAALRSGFMGTLLVIARATGREYDAPSALAAAALGLTLWQPTLLWDTGFQLSATGTLGIIALASPLRHWLDSKVARLPFRGVIAEAVSTTLAAQVATFPLTAINFGIFSLVSPVANLLLVPFLPAFLVIGGLLGTLGLLAPPLGSVLAVVIWPLLRLADLVVEVLAAPPDAALSVGAIPSWLTPLWAMAIGLSPLAWRRGAPAPAPSHPAPGAAKLPAALRTGLALTAVLLLFPASVGLARLAPSPLVRVTFLDVGPGGPATLVQTADGHTALIDGGADGQALLQALAGQLPFWNRTIDLVVLTNPRPAHLAGLPAILTNYHIGEVVDGGVLHPATDYASWFASLQRAGVALIHLAQGATVALGAARLVVLAPTGTLVTTTGQEDDNALVFRLEAPGLRILFLGEGGSRALALASLDNQTANIVQLCTPPTDARQASQLDLVAQSAALLMIMMPAGGQPPQGTVVAPPDPATTSLPPQLATATDGTVTISSDGAGWWVEGRDATVLSG